MVYTWWCWHICKGKVVRVETDQLGEETEVKQTHASAGPVHPVMLYSEGAGIGLRPDVGFGVDLKRRR